LLKRSENWSGQIVHQAWILEEAEATKARIVFDALRKARKSELSSNDCRHV